jgi:hypothetical protein
MGDGTRISGSAFNRQIESSKANLSDHELALVNLSLVQKRFNSRYVKIYSPSEQKRDIAILTRVISVLSAPEKNKTFESQTPKKLIEKKEKLSIAKDLLATVKTAVPLQKGDSKLRALSPDDRYIELNRDSLYQIEKAMLAGSNVVKGTDAFPRLQSKTAHRSVTTSDFANYEEAKRVQAILTDENSKNPTAANRFWEKKADTIVDLLRGQIQEGLPTSSKNRDGNERIT